MIPPEIIDRLAKAFENETDLKMATMKVLMQEEDYDNPAAVKVVTDNNGYALYFSRSLLPYPRNKTEQYKVYKHVGIYAYRRDFLCNMQRWNLRNWKKQKVWNSCAYWKTVIELKCWRAIFRALALIRRKI